MSVAWSLFLGAYHVVPDKRSGRVGSCTNDSGGISIVYQWSLHWQGVLRLTDKEGGGRKEKKKKKKEENPIHRDPKVTL